MLVIQLIHIQWTKATRGAPRARERSAIPRRFMLSGERGPCVIERHAFSESNGFAPAPPRVKVLDAVPRACEALLLLAPQADGTVQVGFGSYGGAPARRPRPQAMRIAPGEWGRLAVNARHASYDGQWYTETVAHLAAGDRIAPNRFLDGEPTHVLDLMADLF